MTLVDTYVLLDGVTNDAAALSDGKQFSELGDGGRWRGTLTCPVRERLFGNCWPIQNIV